MSTDTVSRALQSKDISRTKRKLDGRGKSALILRYLVLTFMLVLAVLPIYIMVVNSIKGITAVSQSTAFIPPSKLNFDTWGPTWVILREPMFRTLIFVLQSSIISAILLPMPPRPTWLARKPITTGIARPMVLSK